jgi:acyl-CoA synthetase (AMP-forming)/AMP-acid ligase II
VDGAFERTGGRPRVITVVDGAAPALLECIGEVRAEGRAVLIADPRWSVAQRASVEELARESDVPADAAWAALTSGSSGQARMVLRTASSWSSSFETVATLLDAGPDDVVSLPAPPAASLTLFSLAHALEGGPRPALGLDVDATCVHATPEGLRMLLDAGGTPRRALVGGSHLDPALRTRAEDAGVGVVSYYGAAELSFVAIDSGAGLRAFPGVEVELRGGEVWVRSPFLALGYLGAGGPLERSGEWATVGDRAELTDGRLHLRGRRDGAILSASATVVPDEVEAALRSIPGVRDAVVFGMPRAGVGALVAAFVELEGDGPVDLRAEAAERLAPAQRPRRWFFGAVPRTPSGKPARADAERLAAATGRDRG